MKNVICDGPAWRSDMPSQFVWLPLKEGTELRCERGQVVDYDRIENPDQWIAAGLIQMQSTAPVARVQPADAAAGEKKDK